MVTRKPNVQLKRDVVVSKTQLNVHLDGDRRFRNVEKASSGTTPILAGDWLVRVPSKGSECIHTMCHNARVNITPPFSGQVGNAALERPKSSGWDIVCSVAVRAVDFVHGTIRDASGSDFHLEPCGQRCCVSRMYDVMTRLSCNLSCPE